MAHAEQETSSIIREKVENVRKAASQGDGYSQYLLGVCYRDGNGVTQDNALAVEWFRKAEEHGLPGAGTPLAYSLYEGGGGTKGYPEAVKRFRKMIESGDNAPASELGLCYENGKGVPRDLAEAVKWYTVAANVGDTTAYYLLGKCYADGLGITQNYEEAYIWLWKAKIDDGNKDAGKLLDKIEALMTAPQRAQAFYRATGKVLLDPKAASSLPPSPSDVSDAPSSSAPGDSSAADTSYPDPFAVPSPKSMGTAFFITPSGYLVTNYHVVKGAQAIKILTSTGDQAAKLVRADEGSDLALLKVAGKFDALPVTSSRKVRLGQSVATVGFPNPDLQGVSPKLTKGEIGSLAGVQDDVREFQISVPVQPGNSGGALLDQRGNVVGVVVASLNQKAALESSGTIAQNVNYAIKSSYLLSFLESIPDVAAEMLDERVKDQPFEDVVEQAKKATVMVMIY